MRPVPGIYRDVLADMVRRYGVFSVVAALAEIHGGDPMPIVEAAIDVIRRETSTEELDANVGPLPGPGAA